METYLEEKKEKKVNVFKSYYVVWKPRFVAENPRIIGTFKSYYVVWKPKNALSKKKIIDSLNRTM